MSPTKLRADGVQDAASKVTEDAKQAAGKVHNTVGSAKDAVRDAARKPQSAA